MADVRTGVCPCRPGVCPAQLAVEVEATTSTCAPVAESRCLLIDASAQHPGAGSCYVDNAFERSFVQKLGEVWGGLPTAQLQAACTQPGHPRRGYGRTAAERRLFCDAEGWVCHRVAAVATAALGQPHMLLVVCRWCTLVYQI